MTFFFAINMGTLSTVLTPLLRTNISYAVMFGMNSLLVGFSIIIIWTSRGAYVDIETLGSVFPTAVKVIVSAVRVRKNELSDLIVEDQVMLLIGLMPLIS
jgi:dipeptide/tripeptide permease